MFIPIGTDRRLKQTPWVNYILIGVNIVIFVLTFRQIAEVSALAQYGVNISDPRVGEELIKRYPVLTLYLYPHNLRLHQFLTYQFLHGGWEHLLFNMLFLYVFGNNVEDRLGKIGYLAFYLIGGVVAGIGHAILESAPVLGASGAVCAVTGAYLALFPLTGITIFYWFFFFIGTFEVSSIILICFQIAENLFFQFGGQSGVAYLAHLAGYAYGFLIGMGLLWIKLLSREPYDMLALFERHRRRNQFRGLTKAGYHPWDHGKPREQVSTSVKKDKQLSTKQKQVMQLRSSIATSATNHDLPAAARWYGQLLDVDPQQVLSLQQQLDVANQLMAEDRHELAARAYELFLSSYKDYGQHEQVELILGLINARYLNRRQRARELLTTALPRLHNSQQKDLARQVLAEIA